MRTNISRITVSNVAPQALAAFVSDYVTSGTVFQSYGFWTDTAGGRMKFEQGATLEITLTEDWLWDCYSLATTIAAHYGEQCVYITVNGRSAYMVYSDGKVETL